MHCQWNSSTKYYLVESSVKLLLSHTNIFLGTLTVPATDLTRACQLREKLLMENTRRRLSPRSADYQLIDQGEVVFTSNLFNIIFSLSRYGIRNSNSYFAFSVGCFADQGGYFSNNNNNGHGYRNPAEVIIFEY